MNQRKFIQQYTYALDHDFTSPSGESAAWVPGHPKYWNQERAKIRLDGTASTPALSPDDKLVAVGVEEDIHVFHVATQERLEVLRGNTGAVEKVQFATGLVHNFENQIDTGYWLVSESDAENNRMVILWELDKHGKLASSKEKRDQVVDVDTLAAKALQPLISDLTADYGWDPAGKSIGTLDQGLRNALRNAIKTHEQENRLCFEGQLARHGSPAFSPDGKTLIYLTQNEATQSGPRDIGSLPCVNLWDVESRSLRHKLLGHKDAIMWAAMSPDNLLVASIAWDGTARVWDVSSGVCLHVLGPLGGQLWCGAFSPDGKYLAISQGSPETYIHVYEIGSGQPVSRFDGFHRWVRSLAWSPDGTMLACGAEQGELRILDPYTGMERMRWRLAFENPNMRRFATVRGVQFVDGGRRLMFQINEGTVEVYHFESNLKQQFTRRAEDKMEKCPRSEMVCSGDSRLLVVPDVDGVLRLWDL